MSWARVFCENNPAFCEQTNKVLETYQQLSYYELIDEDKRTSYFVWPVPELLWRIQILQICVDPIQELDSVWEMQLCYSVISELVGFKTKSRQHKAYALLSGDGSFV